ncbi:cytochrome c oxidase assembly protein [Sphaerisporangium perillae]|uniref:cytochrome c oxidase assembly protein n=1 Tax=Sphaerisporangium perillae TaxID=2935860 RepID=UPI00200D944D|nr:cytochrome c oxidase assembly protein [Sphaerisporangium perillae]
MASPRRSIVFMFVFVGIAAVAVLFVASWFGGGWPRAGIPGLPSPGLLTTVGLPVVRVLHDICAVATVGTLLTAVALAGDPASRREITRAAGPWALAWAAAAALTQILTLSDLLGLPVGEALESGFLPTYSMEVPQGQAFMVVTLLALVIAAGTTLRLGTWGRALLLVLAVFTVLPPAYVGHSASAADHNIAVSSLMLHIAGVTLWVGGLFGLVTHLRRSEGPALAVRRFSAIALCCFVAVGASGLVNAWIRLGGPTQLWETRYGLLILAKLAALALLGGFGWTHRHRTIATLDPAPAVPPPADPGLAPTLDPAPAVASSAAPESVPALDAASAVPPPADPDLTPAPDTTPAVPSPAGPDPAPLPAPGSGIALLGRVAGAGAFVRLATAEIAVMACTIALAVGLSRTPPPRAGALHDQHQLLGYTLPPFAPWRLITETRPDPIVILAVAGVAIAYLVGVRRLVRRGEPWPAGRTLAAMAGLLILLYGLAGGVSAYGPAMFSMHALQYALIGTVGPALLALGAPLVPVQEAAPLAQRTANGPVALGLSNPLTATALYAVPYLLLYVTGLFQPVQSSLAVRLASVTVMAVTGTWFFCVALGLDPLPRAISPVIRTRMLVGALVVQAWVALVFIGGPTQGEDWYGALAIPWAPDRVTDQQAGAVLGAGPAAVTIAALLVLMAVWRRRARRRVATRDPAPQPSTARS